MELSGKKFKTMDIKGKPYVTVAERVKYLRFDFDGNYSVETDYQYFEKQRLWVVKAKLTLIQDGNAYIYTATASEVESDDYKKVNFTSALENAETSAVGRACAMAGIGIEEGIASANEIKGVERKTTAKQANVAISAKATPEPAKSTLPDGLLDTIAGAVNYDELLLIWNGNKDLKENLDFSAAITRRKDELDKYTPDIHPLQNPHGVPRELKKDILLKLNNSVFTQQEKEKVQTKLREYDKVTEPGKAKAWSEKTLAYLDEQIKQRTQTAA